MTTYQFTPASTQAFDPSDDVLQFTGDSAAVVTITSSGGNTVFTTSAGSMTLTGLSLGEITTTNIVFSDGSMIITGDNTTSTTPDNNANIIISGVYNDLLFGMGGSDIIEGGSGNDVLYGGSGVSDSGDSGDVINAGTGNDVIYGNGGADIITGSSGSDTVYGGVGNDDISYASNSDSVLLYGNAGADTITSGDGDDVIYGGNGTADTTDSTDSINGGNGNDIIYANAGNDTVTGTSGLDSVYGGLGNDILSYSADSYALLLYGNGGTDTITGGAGADTLYGGDSADDTADSADTITANGGANLIYAASGADRVTGTASSGSDTVYGGADNDIINYSASTATNTNNLIYGNAGTDTITGSGGNDTIYGGSSSNDSSDSTDSITAGAGADLIYANSGDDTVTGSGAGTAQSTIYGGAGNDTINWSAVTGGNGANLYGNEGNDSITGSTGSGVDFIAGGSGNDTIIFTSANDLSSTDTIWGGDAASDASDAIDTLKFTANSVTLLASDLTHVSGIEAITFLDDNNTNEITLNNSILASSATHNLVISLATVGGASDLKVNASAVSSTSYTISVTGGNGADELKGGAGNDTLIGGEATDYFYETVSGATGSGYISGGESMDVINITSANLTDKMTIDGGTEDDTLTITDSAIIIDADFTHLTSIQKLTLQSNANSIVLGSYANAMIGASSWLDIDNGTNTISLLNTSAISNDRDIIIMGSGQVTLANGVDNRVVIDGGATYILGGNGADTLVTEAADVSSAYTLAGGAGVDTLKFTTDADLDFTTNIGNNLTGIDAISLLANSAMVLTLSDTLVNASDADSLAITLQNNQGVSVIANGLSAGHTVNFTGGSGADTFETEASSAIGSYTVTGGAAVDTLKLSTDADLDFVTNSSYDDHLTGIDAISLLADSDMVLTLSDALVAASDAGSIAITLQNDNGVSVNASNIVTGHTIHFTGGAGTDNVIGGAGADTIVSGGGGGDISGNMGNDNIIVGAGVDVITMFSTDGAAGTGAGQGGDIINSFVWGTDKFNYEGDTLVHGSGDGENLADETVTNVANNGTANANGLIYTFQGSGDLLAAGTLVANAVTNAVTALTSTSDFSSANVTIGDSFLLQMNDGSNSFIFYYNAQGTANVTEADDLTLLAKFVGTTTAVVTGDII